MGSQFWEIPEKFYGVSLEYFYGNSWVILMTCLPCLWIFRELREFHLKKILRIFPDYFSGNSLEILSTWSPSLRIFRGIKKENLRNSWVFLWNFTPRNSWKILWNAFPEISEEFHGEKFRKIFQEFLKTVIPQKSLILGTNSGEFLENFLKNQLQAMNLKKFLVNSSK